jgi:lysozyme family protein
MAADTFDRALALVLDLEGGFVDHPRDPGGATNLGVTRATLAKARGRPVTVSDVRALTRAEAGTIYRRSYWDAVRGDDLPAGLDLAVFDYAVNSGPSRAVRSLQAVLGTVQDGRIGPKTIAAAAARNTAETVRALTRERLRFLRALSTWPVFGRGWTSRTTRVEAAALAAAAAAPSAPQTVLSSSQPREETRHMGETKSPLASRTVWANIIGLGSLALGTAGVQTGALDQSGLAEALAQVAAGISFIASTYFRLQATKQITPAVK